MLQTYKTLVSIILFSLVIQFAFTADNANEGGKEQFISPEQEIINAQTEKEQALTPGEYNKMYPSGNGTGGSRDCVNDDSTSDGYGDTCSSWYDSNESEGSYGCSGGYNDDDFDASDQCCACGGGDSGSSGPGWEDNPGLYEFTASMTADIVVDGTRLSDDGDILAAFDADGNVRGVSVQLDVPANFPSDYAGLILFELQIRSNAGGDGISFKYYDSSEDLIQHLRKNHSI
jgi:hypothetical protein